MNNKGQSLITFVLVLPILLLLIAFIVDIGIMYNAKIKGEHLLSYAKENNKDVKEYFKINDIEVNITSNDSNNCDIIKYKVDSVFGNIVGYREYQISIEDC